MLDRLKHIFKSKNSNSEPIFGDEQISRFVSYLVYNVENIESNPLLKEKVREINKLEPKDKKNFLAGLYLLFERNIFSDPKFATETDKKNFREDFKSKFPTISQTPEMSLIFQERIIQEKLICILFLKKLIQNSFHSFDSSGKGYIKNINDYLDELTSNINSLKADKSKKVIGKLKTYTSEIFNRLHNKVGKKLATEIFQGVYNFMADNYRLLNSFHEVIVIIPEEVLNEQQIGMLSKKHMQNMLVDKVGNLEAVNTRLNEEIRDRKKAEAALKDSEQRLAQIIGSAMDAVVIFNSSGIIMEWNKQAEILLGYSKEEIIGKQVHKTILPDIEITKNENDEPMIKIGDQFPINTNNLRIELKSVTKSNTEIETELSISPISYHDEKIFSAFVRDITQRKKYEREILDAKDKAEQASISKAQFLSTMSHEIRTPLNAVIGISNLLLKSNPSKEQIEDLKILKFSGENLLSIINDILDFNKIDAGKIELEKAPFNIKTVINGVKSSLSTKAYQKNLPLVLYVDDNLPDVVVGDSTRLTQILTNLINNAIKFTHKGSVTIAVSVISNEEDEIEIRFSIRDTGIGISTEEQNKIFDSFSQASSSTTRKYGGTGLGLSICKKLLELQDSNLMLESEIGKGSEFFFTLKFGKSDIQIAPEELNINDDKKDLAKAKILVAEDNKVNLLIAVKYLNRWNAIVDTAENGIEVIEKCKKNDYDLVLMDLQMPDMDGIEATKQIRSLNNKKFQSLPIIALTASAMMEVKRQVLEAGMNDFAAKPLNPELLYEKIYNHIFENKETMSI
ncbi:PAS domain-containing hybrid sensor histidine kinase/response regulator [Marinigracilibium pacificum]|uniref:histidine kinase n=1 Tax=Marinigracilibium pacificum TaxID=2729599 RepID=A0A848J1J9_9BACT|nr:ATP-binding protein [Marinigracilibium pacificum]NMM48410.1 response regulator [Marinigracilibium pacificum]